MSFSMFSNLKISFSDIFVIIKVDLLSSTLIADRNKQPLSPFLKILEILFSQSSISGLERPILKCLVCRAMLLRCFTIMQDFPKCLHTSVSDFLYPTP